MSVRLDLTRDELGLLIDGVAHLVDPDHREAAPLLHRLQAARSHAPPEPASPEWLREHGFTGECGRFYAPPAPADYLFCYEPAGHVGPCDFQPRRRNST